MPQWQVPGYTELSQLGSGGFGVVMLARHDESGVLVAIKYLNPDLLADQEFTTLFRGEAQTLAALDDRNIVRLYEYVESQSGAAIVMELIDGVTLRAILARQGSTTPEAALVVLQGSLLGLAAAHWHGVVHRDYKPENVLVDGEGVSKLTDFGIAARAGDRPFPAGTLPYAAPEQIAGAPAGPASDVYAATVTFYECLTGHPPFTGDTEALLRQHRSEPVPLEPVPEPLRPLVADGMAKDPDLRPVDGIALVAKLRAAAAGTYGEDWEERGRSHLSEAAVLLAALWPSRGTPAAQGAMTEEVPLARRGRPRRPRRLGQPRWLGRIGPLRAAIGIGIAALVAAAGIAVFTTSSQQPTSAATPPAVTVAPLPLGSASAATSDPAPSPAASLPSHSPSPAPPSPSGSAASLAASPPAASVAPSASATPAPSASPTSSPSPSPSPSGCQPDGTGCVKAGSYPGPDLVINSAYGGLYKVVWAGSVVAGATAPASWTADITYTNVTSGALVLNCQGAWTAASYVSEIVSGGSVAASSTTCSQDPSLAAPVPAGGSYTLTATFDTVPSPGSDVAVTWGNAGTSASVSPFG
jgi:eukaryotic-like serine/threonine-protein kinase